MSVICTFVLFIRLKDNGFNCVHIIINATSTCKNENLREKIQKGFCMEITFSFVIVCTYACKEENITCDKMRPLNGEPLVSYFICSNHNFPSS